MLPLGRILRLLERSPRLLPNQKALSTTLRENNPANPRNKPVRDPWRSSYPRGGGNFRRRNPLKINSQIGYHPNIGGLHQLSKM
jgi:hypothetical protein